MTYMTAPLQAKPGPHGAPSHPQVGIVDPRLDAHSEDDVYQRERVSTQYLFGQQKERSFGKGKKKEENAQSQASQPHSPDKPRKIRLPFAARESLGPWHLGGVIFAPSGRCRCSHWLSTCRQGLDGSRLGNPMHIQLTKRLKDVQLETVHLPRWAACM